MVITLIIFYYIFLVFLAFFALYSLFNIFHLLVFGFFTATNVFIVLAYLAVSFLLISFIFSQFNTFNWQQPFIDFNNFFTIS